MKKTKQKQYHFNEHDINQVEGIRRRRKAVKLKKKVKLLIFLMFLIAFGFYLSSDHSNVKEINITGNNWLSDEEILDLLDIDVTNKHIFLIPMLLEQRLEKESLIKNVTISKGLFNKLNVSIEESKLIAYILEGDLLSVVDVSGNISVLNSKNALFEIQNHPRIKGFNDLELLEKFTKEYAQLNESIRNQISDITFDPEEYTIPTRLRIDMSDGMIVFIKIEDLVSSLDSYNQVRSIVSGKCIFDYAGKYVYGQGEECHRIGE